MGPSPGAIPCALVASPVPCPTSQTLLSFCSFILNFGPGETFACGTLEGPGTLCVCALTPGTAVGTLGVPPRHGLQVRWAGPARIRAPRRGGLPRLLPPGPWARPRLSVCRAAAACVWWLWAASWGSWAPCVEGLGVPGWCSRPCRAWPLGRAWWGSWGLGPLGARRRPPAHPTLAGTPCRPRFLGPKGPHSSFLDWPCSRPGSGVPTCCT